MAYRLELQWQTQETMRKEFGLEWSDNNMFLEL